MSPRIAMALCASLALAGCRRGAAPEVSEDPTVGAVAVHCAPATLAPLHDVRTLRGSVAAPPDRDAVVAPQLAGRLLHVLVREGDAVREGDVVAEVESQAARDALVQAQAQLAQANAQSRNFELTLGRAQHLFDRGIAARQEVDDAQAHRAEGSAQVSAARAAVDVASRAVARATVRAPIAGVVVHVMRRAGELVDGTPATPVLEVADPSVEELMANATPADIVRLRAGQGAQVRFDALPGQVYAASVRTVPPAIDPATGVSAVRLALVPGDSHPPLGLFGTATIVTADRTGLVVPAGAMRGAGAGSEVVVCDGDHARVRSVDVGVRDEARVEVTRGISAGDLVVVDRALGLEDGAAIRVLR